MHGTSPREATFPVASFGGLVALAVPESLPDGASPRTWNTDYLVGQAKTRDGLRSVYNHATGEAGPNTAGLGNSSTWNNASAITGASSFASFSPASASNVLQATQFAFALSNGSIITTTVTAKAYANAPATLSAQLLVGGIPIGRPLEVTLGTTADTVTFSGIFSAWGTLPLKLNQVNSTGFGVQFTVSPSGGFIGATAYIQDAQITLGINTGFQSMQPLTTFTNQDGSRYNLVMDAAGELWVESLDSDPGVLALSRTGIQPGSMAVQVQGEGVDYLAFVKPGTLGGNDMPLQWTPTSQNRITQVGPGAAPTFTPTQASSQDYPIASITQPAQKTQGFAYFLQSLGAANTDQGMVVTIYYLDAMVVSGHDPDLLAAVNSGYPVYLWAKYVYGASKTPKGDPNMSDQVVGPITLGEGQPPGQPHNYYYFQFVLTTGSPTFNYSDDSDAANVVTYQRTLATLTTTEPVPNLEVNDNMVVTGVTPTNWNSTWKVTETPNASEMVITGSQVGGSLGAGVAQLTYAVTNGTNPPAAGEIVIITNTLNAGGALNGTWTISAVSGGDTGTFQILTSVADTAFRAENGYANTEGTIFCFDPGATEGAGSTTNPIFGNAGAGGDVVFNASGVYIDPGTYQGTQFFILPDGSYTMPAPPRVFTVPENTTQLLVTGLLIGPPNVVGRGIAITEAGQNGVPGANFFTLTNPVIFYNDNQKLPATSFLVNDNTTQSVNLYFTSAVLNSATAIDVYGYNLFNCYEIGDPAWVTSYASRNWYGQCLNRVQNFYNMSFDGGYLASTSRLVPSYWAPQDTYGTLVVSPRFGNAWYIQNTSGATIPGALGLLTQTSFQDPYQQNILQPNTGYSVRVWARSPSAAQVGNLVIALVAGSVTLGSVSIPLSSMATSYIRFIDVILADPGVGSIPPTAQIEVYGEGFAANADVEVDRVEVFPTDIPVLTNTVFASYAGLPTMVDAVTGQVIFASENQQPVQMATVLYDTLYAMKGWSGTAPGSSLYSLQQSAGFEPADWNEPEVAQRSGGACGPFAWDGGEQWLAAASRAGLYLFAGGQPGKITQEIQPIWDAINWSSAAAAASITVDINLRARRILIGVPMATPNFWLPFAPVNANPTAPNVWLMCNFQGLDDADHLKAEPEMHTTMFGTLAAVDMRRKWSLWYSGTNPGSVAQVQGPNGEETRFGNGVHNSKVYALDPTEATDDGNVIDSGYTTSGFPLLSKMQQFPQLGPNRVRWTYFMGALASGGTINLRFLGNRLFFPEPQNYIQWTVPGGFTPGLQPVQDTEASLNFPSSRTFLEFRQNDGEQGWTLSNVTLRGRKDAWNAMTGQK